MLTIACCFVVTFQEDVSILISPSFDFKKNNPENYQVAIVPDRSLEKRRNSSSLFSFQVKRDADDNYAEKNGPFIFWCVNKIWGYLPDYSVSSPQQIQQPPNNQRGLYIFFIELGPFKYPIYIGITSRNFRQRFVEHHNSPNGVIYRFIHGNFPQNTQPHLRSQLLLKVICIPLSYPMQAKLMESVFLSAFDFCLNTEENGHIRVNIDANHQFPVEESKSGFDITFNNVIEEISSVFNSYRF